MKIHSDSSATVGNFSLSLSERERAGVRVHSHRMARPEMLVFACLILVFSGSVLFGSFWQSMMFQPAAVMGGEWWRLFTHPFVHITWYHLLLDASAFFLLYNSLLEVKLMRRLAYVFASAAGSLLLSWMTAPAISTGGLCGLSGIAHGLMAVSAVEMMANQPRHSPEWRVGAFTFALVVGKAAFEAISGKILFGFLYFGMVGNPVAVSHAGGIVGGLLAMLLLQFTSRASKAMTLMEQFRPAHRGKT
jgi:rhomboid family GlyGly-CTERM serine protease